MLPKFKTRSLQTLLCSLIIVFTNGCETENPLDIDVSGIEVSVELGRLDQAWVDLTPVSYRERHPQWQAEYGELYQRYVEDVLGLGGWNDSNLFNQIRRFTTDRSILEVHSDLEQQFSDLEDVQVELEEAWKHYKYYFPNQEIPKHMIFMGGFNTPLAVTDEALGIGLEMYMGKDAVYYEFLQIPLFIRQRMTRAHMAPTALKGWISSDFVLDEENPTLLDKIVHEGKVLFAMDAMFPQADDTLKIFYDGKGMKWAVEHEEFVWAHFIDKAMLFETDAALIGKYTNDGPFTVDLAKESPSGMGTYIGWQIVKAYMERQDEIDLTKMMSTDAEEILNNSKYKP